MLISPARRDAILARQCKREGGYVDHTMDHGGPTKFGITIPTLSAHRGYPVSAADVRTLEIFEAIAIYRAGWWDHPRLQLSEWPAAYAGLAEVVLDAAPMFGNGRKLAAFWVQEGINRYRPPGSSSVAVDGWMGPLTRTALQLCHEAPLIACSVVMRCRKHIAVVKERPDQIAFLEGWHNRATDWLLGGPPALEEWSE